MTGEEMYGGFLFLILVIFYLIPAIIARKKENGVAIAFLNIILGWTIIGWVVCFIWGCVSKEK